MAACGSSSSAAQRMDRMSLNARRGALHSGTGKPFCHLALGNVRSSSRTTSSGSTSSSVVKATPFHPVSASVWAKVAAPDTRDNRAARAPRPALVATKPAVQISKEQLLQQKVEAVFDSLNRRDIPALAECLSSNIVYENLAEAAVFTGRDSVLVWFRHLMGQVPGEAWLHVDAVSTYINSGACEATVEWHVEVSGLSVPWSRGSSTYVLGQSKRIIRIVDSLQLPLGLALPALSLASPAVGVATPLLSSLQRVISFSGSVVAQLRPWSGEGPFSGGGLSTFTDGAEPPALPSLSFPTLPNFPFPSGWLPLGSSGGPTSSSEAGSGASSSSSSSQPSGSGKESSGGGGRPGGPQVRASKQVLMRVLPLTDVGEFLDKEGSRSGSRGEAGGSSSSSSSSASGRGLRAPSRQTPNGAATSASFEPPGAAASSSGGQVDVDGDGAAQPQTNLSGVWSKDLSASDELAYEAMLDVLGLSGLQRVTARLIEGVEIRHVPGESFDVSFLTVVPFFKVTESSRIGYRTSLMRRDLRPGSQRSVAEEVLGGVRVSMDWGAPNAGALQEVYMLEGESMSVLSSVAVGSRKASAVLMYRRTQGGADALLRESRARNSSFDVVMARQREQFGRK